MATGYNVVDLDAAGKRNIPVTNVPKYGTQSVAQMVIALLLEMTQQVAHHAQTVREGRWAKSPDFCYWDYPLIELDASLWELSDSAVSARLCSYSSGVRDEGSGI